MDNSTETQETQEVTETQETTETTDQSGFVTDEVIESPDTNTDGPQIEEDTDSKNSDDIDYSYVPEKFLNEDGKPDFEKLSKSYSALEKKLGAPAETPESPDDYQYDFEYVDNLDEEQFNEFKNAALEKGITKEQYSWIMSQFDSTIGQMTPSPDAAATQLQEVWGKDFEQNLSAANMAISAYLPEGYDIQQDPTLGNNPIFAQIMAKIGAEMVEDSPDVSAPLSTPAGMSELEFDEFKRKHIADETWWTDAVQAEAQKYYQSHS